MKLPRPLSMWGGYPVIQRLNAALLRRAAAVVRDRCHVGDVGDLQTTGVQRAHRRFAARAGALHADFDRLHAMFLRGNAGLFGRNLRSERRALTRTTEPATTRGCP